MKHEILSNGVADLHPANIEKLEGYEQHGQYLTSVANLFGATYKAHASVATLAQELAGNASMTEAERVLKVDEVMHKHFQTAYVGFNAARDSLNKMISQVDGELSREVESRSLGAMNAEIRTFFRNADREERNSLLAKAIRENDTATVSSVLAGPAYLSGFTDDEKKLYTEQYRKVSEPNRYAEKKLMEKALAKVNQRALRLADNFQDATGFTNLKTTQIRNAKAKADAALKAAV